MAAHGFAFGLLPARTRRPVPALVLDLRGLAGRGVRSGRRRVATGRGGPPVWAEPLAPADRPAAPRPHVVEVRATFTAGRLTMEWTYRADRHRRATVAGRAERCLRALTTAV